MTKTTANATPANKPDLELPKRCFARGNIIWVRCKDENGKWMNTSTDYTLVPDQREDARRFVKAFLNGIEKKREMLAAGGKPTNTVAEYIEAWLKDRVTRGIAAATHDEPARLEKVLPYIGHLRVEDVRPRDVRDMVRGLCGYTGKQKLAPRTILHVFGTLHNVFESAVVDELVTGNPIVVKKGELPKKVDADPEWRSRATYTVREVERLISDAIIPVERRVQYALKAIAGMRHGEVAALCWRHLDYDAAPLARINVCQSYSSATQTVKSTKTEETRAVPMHPTLAKILEAWRTKHWPRIYGRKPTDDDFVVPARTMNPVHSSDANHAMKDDLLALGMRLKAGTKRDRGGHDLRSWYKTRTIEDGADSLVIKGTTHAADKSVEGGYQRFSWATVCRELKKLKVKILDGQVLPVVTKSLQAEKKAGGRWTSAVTPSRLEGESLITSGTYRTHSGPETKGATGSDARTREHGVTNVTRGYVRTAADMLERAIRSGDTARAMRIVKELRGDQVGVLPT